MPRTPRIELAGGIHHVTERGNRREPIFQDDRDRWSLLQELAIVTARYRWICLAYCLMPNHIHLVIETPEPTLGLGMRQLAGHYVQSFNARHGVPGHAFQGRYGSVLVRRSEYFAQLLRYVALNPVAAGLCDDPVEWRWSNHGELLAGSEAPGLAHARVEALLEEWGGEPGTRYARLFDASHPLALKYGSESPWDYRPPLKELLTADCLDDGMRLARERGYRLTEIAAAVGLHPSTVSRRTSRAN